MAWQAKQWAYRRSPGNALMRLSVVGSNALAIIKKSTRWKSRTALVLRIFVVALCMAVPLDEVRAQKVVIATCLKHYPKNDYTTTPGISTAERAAIDESAEINKRAVDLADQPSMQREAETLYRKALAIIADNRHASPMRRGIYFNLSELYRKQGSDAASFDITLQVIEEIEKSRGFGSLIIANTLGSVLT